MDPELKRFQLANTLTPMFVTVPSGLTISDDGFLRMEWDETKYKETDSILFKDCLPQFMRLAHDPTPEKIRAFMEKWGSLGLCQQCGFPESHQGDCDLPYVHITNKKYELVEDWIRYSKQASAIIKIAERLQNGMIGEESDWLDLKELTQKIKKYFDIILPIPAQYTPLYTDSIRMVNNDTTKINWPLEEKDAFYATLKDLDWKTASEAFKKHKEEWLTEEDKEQFLAGVYNAEMVNFQRYVYIREVNRQRRKLSMCITRLAGPRYANLRPHITWEDCRTSPTSQYPQTRLHSPSPLGEHEFPNFTLFDFIVEQLIATITSGVYLCDMCGNSYTPEDKRSARADRRHLCSPECKEEAQRDSRRKYNQSLKGKETEKRRRGQAKDREVKVE